MKTKEFAICTLTLILCAITVVRTCPAGQGCKKKGIKISKWKVKSHTKKWPCPAGNHFHLTDFQALFLPKVKIVVIPALQAVTLTSQVKLNVFRLSLELTSLTQEERRQLCVQPVNFALLVRHYQRNAQLEPTLKTPRRCAYSAPRVPSVLRVRNPATLVLQALNAQIQRRSP